MGVDDGNPGKGKLALLMQKEKQRQPRDSSAKYANIIHPI
jgi:hypothetical protein